MKISLILLILISNSLIFSSTVELEKKVALLDPLDSIELSQNLLDSISEENFSNVDQIVNKEE